MQILAISGSLRAASTNATLLKAAAALVPEDVTLNLYDGLGDLPPFNPDVDKYPPHAAVADFRSQLRQSAAVIFSTPEYAHGVPGVLKNALDWVVASGELYGKPVALFSASPRAGYAQASLVETLTVLSARVVPGACVVAPLLGKNLREDEIAAEPDLSRAVRSALRALARATSIQSDVTTRAFLEHEEPVGYERW
jgi:chromate reductase, NAD(P)H dehydrogenase (quinone)